MTGVCTQTFPDPLDLRAAVDELRYLPGWNYHGFLQLLDGRLTFTAG